MGLKIVAIAVILAFVAGTVLVLIGTPIGSIAKEIVAPSPSPEKEGSDCTGNVDCFEELSEKCEKGYTDLSDAGKGIEGFAQVLGKTEKGCEFYVEITEHPDKPEIVQKLSMKCYLSALELEEIQETVLGGSNTRIEEYDCSGSLYDAMKASQ